MWSVLKQKKEGKVFHFVCVCVSEFFSLLNLCGVKERVAAKQSYLDRGSRGMRAYLSLSLSLPPPSTEEGMGMDLFREMDVFPFFVGRSVRNFFSPLGGEIERICRSRERDLSWMNRLRVFVSRCM